MTKAYQERLITLVRDTVTLLCKNGLEYNQEFCVEGLLGVTLDKGEVFLIPVRELVNDKGVGTTDTADDTLDTSQFDESARMSPKRERKKKRKHVHSTMMNEDDSLNYDTGMTDWDQESIKGRAEDDRVSNTTDDQPSHKRSRDNRTGIKAEINDDDDSHDVVVIKEEIGDDEFVNAFQGGSLDNSALNRTEHNDPALAFFSQPGTSQMNFSMDQLASGSGITGAMSASLPAGVQGDESWLQQSGDTSMGDMGSPTGTPGGQKHQVNHMCPVCGSSFSRRTHLQRHLRTVHFNVKVVCNLCGRAFTRQENLKLHIKMNHHDIQDTLVDSQPPPAPEHDAHNC